MSIEPELAIVPEVPPARSELKWRAGLAGVLRFYKESNDLSYREMEQRLKLDHSTIESICKGHGCSVDTLLTLSREMGLTIEELLVGFI